MLRTLIIIAFIWALGAVLAWLFRARLPAGLKSRWISSAAAVSLIILAERHLGLNLSAIDHLVFYAVVGAATAASFLIVPRFYGPMVNIVITILLLAAGLAVVHLGEEMKRIAYLVFAAVAGFLFFKSFRTGKYLHSSPDI